MLDFSKHHANADRASRVILPQNVNDKSRVFHILTWKDANAIVRRLPERYFLSQLYLISACGLT